MGLFAPKTREKNGKLLTWDSKQEKKERILGYLFILPVVIHMLAFIGYPAIYNWIISFQNVTTKTIVSAAREFAGFSDYKATFADVTSKKALAYTFIYTIGCLSIQFTLSFLFVIFFTKKFILSRPIRGSIVTSWMPPVTVTALVFKLMFTGGNGIINYILMSLHLIDKPADWLLQGSTAMMGLIIANSWVGIPFNMLLLTTGLNNIPGDTYEAVAIDGVTGIQKFLKIITLLLKSTIMSALVLGFMLTFKAFDPVYVMAGEGPVDATEVLSTYFYELSFQLSHFGEGAAVANVLFVCLLMAALIYLRAISKDEATQQAVRWLRANSTSVK